VNLHYESTALTAELQAHRTANTKDGNYLLHDCHRFARRLGSTGGSSGVHQQSRTNAPLPPTGDPGPMKKIRILSLGTVLVLGFAMGAQAQTDTSENTTGDADSYQVGQQNTTGDADGYQVGQPASTSERGKDAAPDQQTAPEPEQQATPAPAGNVTLNPDNWSVPPSL